MVSTVSGFAREQDPVTVFSKVGITTLSITGIAAATGLLQGIKQPILKAIIKKPPKGIKDNQVKAITKLLDKEISVSNIKNVKHLDKILINSIKLKHIGFLFKYLSKKNKAFNKLYQYTIKKQKQLLKKKKTIIKKVNKKLEPIKKTFSIEKVKQAFNNHFDKQTKEYNELINQSRKDTTAIEKLKLQQDMDNFHFRITRSTAY